MKKWILVLGGLFLVALAILIGRGMSPDAMAVVVGVVCGIGASIPTSLLLLMISRRREGNAEPSRPFPAVPPVMIVNPPAGMYGTYQGQPAQHYLPPINGAGNRRFHVVGSDDFGELSG